MLTLRRTIGAGIAGALLIGAVGASFCGAPKHKICQEREKQESVCANYHLIPYVTLETIQFSDANEGFFSFLTGTAVAAFTLGLVLLGQKADRHFRVVERAYVKLSHYPPGIYWEMPSKQDTLYGDESRLEYWIRFDLRVKNFGATPATVMQICMAHRIVAKDESLPAKPDYSDGTTEAVNAFLVTDDEFQNPIRQMIAKSDMDAIWNCEKCLYVFGYAEYLDKFGNRHRSGYARRYELNMDYFSRPVTLRTGQLPAAALREGNNLTFVNQPRYIYDLTQNANGTWPQT